MGELPRWWGTVHCGGVDGQPVRLVRTGRTEHEVAPVGFPDRCPNGHVLAPGRALRETQACWCGDGGHPGVTCGVCYWVWIDPVCTVGPGWQSRETWHRRFVQ